MNIYSLFAGLIALLLSFLFVLGTALLYIVGNVVYWRIQRALTRPLTNLRLCTVLEIDEKGILRRRKPT